MIDLTNLEEIKKIDPKNVFGSAESLADQCEQIWEEGKRLEIPQNYKNVKNILFCGMGGSAYGSYVVSSLHAGDLPIPHFAVNDYHIPKFVDENTLVVLSSYSGTTEEILSCAKEAKGKRAKIVGLTTGGALGTFCIENNYPELIFAPKYNPSGQPRLGTGYMITGTIRILKSIGLVHTTDEEVKKAINELREHTSAIKHHARDGAKELMDTIPVIFAAEFLGGNAHIIRNQFNETAKSFSTFSELPELNHHSLEGLKNPKGKKLTALFITSDLYSDVLEKRIELTKDVVSKNVIPYLEYEAKGTIKLSQVLNVLSYGGYVTLYLALLYGQDPSVIPWVDYFKEQLQKKT